MVTDDRHRGRVKIYTDVKDINSDNVISVLTDALITHSTNRELIEYLFNYEKGIQPINDRVKEVRPEINIKIAENNAAQISDFKISYEFGSPITYVQRSKKQVPASDSDKDDMRITALNEMLFEESKASKDVQLARHFKICGVGYRMVKAKRKPFGKSVFDVLILNPLSTFVVYSNDIYQEPVMACTYSVQKNGNTLYGVYTKDTYFEIDNGTRIVNGVKTEGKWSVMNGKGVKNIPSIIPIVEYVNDYDRMGCFEKVIPILDAINIVNSDRVNDVAQHVQSLLWLNNADIDNDMLGKLREYGIIKTTSTNGVQAGVHYVETTLNQSETQTLVDYLHGKAMKIAGVPERQENSGGGSTGSAMNLSSGWQFAETAAINSESIFEESERRSIQIMLEIIKKSNDIPREFADIVNLSISDVMIRFSRNKIYDIATKSNALSTLIKTGIDAKHAIETVSLFTDPQSVYNDSKEGIEKIQESLNKSGKATTEESDKTNPDMSDQPQKVPFSNT